MKIVFFLLTYLFLLHVQQDIVNIEMNDYQFLLIYINELVANRLNWENRYPYERFQ